MGTQRFVAGPLSVLCILTLVTGTASAVVISATDSASSSDVQTLHPHLSPEAMIDALEKKGVDIAEIRADLQNGDTTAVKAWLENYLHAHEGEVPFHHHPGGSQPMANTNTSQ